MKLIYCVLLILLGPVLVACDQKAPTLHHSSTCVKTDPTTKDCVEWNTIYSCKILTPLFFNDRVAAICKDEADCRAVCDKLRDK